jgi:hypothetical protein
MLSSVKPFKDILRQHHIPLTSKACNELAKEIQNTINDICADMNLIVALNILQTVLEDISSKDHCTLMMMRRNSNAFVRNILYGIRQKSSDYICARHCREMEEG